jgi:hypothetical protein
VAKDLANDFWILDGGDDFCFASTGLANFNIDIENAFE